jgi:GAF domain-containing protein/two-component sensor histidine kinase
MTVKREMRHDQAPSAFEAAGPTPVPSDTLTALKALNALESGINQLAPRSPEDLRQTLRLVVRSVSRLGSDVTTGVPAYEACGFAYDREARRFDLSARVSVGSDEGPFLQDASAPDGLAVRAVERERPVFTNPGADEEVLSSAVGQGVACYPLVVAHEPLGVLYVKRCAEGSFSAFERLLLENFANQAAMALDRVRRIVTSRAELDRAEDALRRLRRAGLLISSRLGLDETLEAILLMALDVTGAHYGIFRLLDAESEQLVTRAIAGDQRHPQMGALPMDTNSVMGWVAVHRQALCIHNLEAAPWVRIYRPLDAGLRMRSELAVPLIDAGGRLEGVLNLESPVIGAFNDEDRRLLQSLATQAVIAIQEARLLDVLLEVARMLLFKPLVAVLDYLAASACTLLNTGVGAIWTLDDDALVLAASSGSGMRGETLPVAESLTGEAVRTRRPVISHDVRVDPRFHRKDLARAHRWGKALVVPLLSEHDEEAVGAFSVYGVGEHSGLVTESEWDTKVLTCLAHHAALALRNAERRQMLREVQQRHAVSETFAAIGDVAANALHHLNNKVGTIPVRIQGIKAKSASAVGSDPYLAENLDAIESSARQAMAAVRENLAHLRPIHATRVSVAACVEAARQDLSIPPKVVLERSGLDCLPPVVASQHSLTLVFRNLIENALRAVGHDGRIQIDGSVEGDWVTIWVEDDGTGIPLDRQDAIFEFDAVSSARERSHSLGFGLWWVRTLMRRLGGSIRVESDGQRGTTFRVRLPRAGHSDA